MREAGRAGQNSVWLGLTSYEWDFSQRIAPMFVLEHHSGGEHCV